MRILCMGYAARNLRELLRQAAALRRTAALVANSNYANKLLLGAAELEAHAAFLAAHPADNVAPGIAIPANNTLHAHVDIKV